MLRILGWLRFKSLAYLLVAALVPFACRQLLTLGIHCQRFFPVPAYSNSGHGGRSARTLVRQLDSQAQESKSDSQKDRWEAAHSHGHPVRPDAVGGAAARSFVRPPEPAFILRLSHTLKDLSFPPNLDA